VTDAGADVSVLIPVLNERAHVRGALATALSQRFEGRIEVLVVDGGSEDGTRELVEELAAEESRVRLLDNPGRSVPRALNLALRDARGEYVARMDGHSYYPPDYVARGLKRLSRGDAEWVMGPALARGEGTWSRRVALALSTWMGAGGPKFHRTAGEREMTTSVFTGVWRRETLLSHGGWDEDWPVNEDVELAGRIRRDGGRIVCVPEMGARYVPRDSLAALVRQYWGYGHYRPKTSRRHPDFLRRSHLFAPGVVATAAAAPLLRGRLAMLARLGLCGYALAVLAESVRIGRRQRASVSDTIALPLVLVAMHASWGAGFWAGCLRFGPPLAGFASWFGRGEGR
jgi:succinoglycan biosynthesis protein ExoA